MTTAGVVDDADDFPRHAVDGSVVARFEAVARTHARAVAVQGEHDTLRYDELDAFANRIARALRDRGGDLAEPVAVLMRHDAALVAALLGVLKAGGCYVVLDPSQPAARLAAILADATARVLVADHTHAALATSLARGSRTSVRLLAVEDTARERGHGLEVVITPSDRACVVYTAGSTGMPKGVVHPHRNLVHGAWSYARLAGIDAGDRLSLLHATTTMAAATTLYGALLRGAAVVPFDVRRHGPERLAAWLDAADVSGLHAVPTVFRRVVQSRRRGERFERVRLVRLGGEAATRTEWELWRQGFGPDTRLHVGLASTETGIVRHAVFTHDDEPPAAVLPVGDPVPDKEVRVLGADGATVTPGAVGEIVVKSPFLFAEYWRRPDETARARDVDPLDGVPTYRTGDLGRLDGRGRLFHCGRADAQVKIDGNRVDLAEVEAAVRAVDGVRDAAVVARARPARLVAFVVTADGAARPDLRARLRERLAAHMVPAAVTAVDALPTLPDGKVDRRTLVARAEHVVAPPGEPRNAVEETLLQIWRQALAIDDGGIHDDFFLDLGGDSLAAVTVLAQVAELFDRALALDAFFDATTVATMAARLVDDGWTPPRSGRLTVHPGGTRRPLFGVCGAFGHALRLMLVGHALDESQPFYGLQPPGMDWEAAGCRSIAAMAAHYVGEIRGVQPSGPYRLLGTSFGGVMAFEIARQLQQAGERVELLAMIDTKPPDCERPDGVDRAPRRDWSMQVDAGDRLVAMGVRVAVAHGDALAGYALRESARFDGAIVYFRCDQPPVPPSQDRRPLWAHYATGGMHVLSVPGMHGDFHREPQFSTVVAHLRGCLAALD